MKALREAERKDDKAEAAGDAADTEAASDEPAAERPQREPVPFDRMTPGMQATLQREAGSYIAVGEKIIAIDGWLQLQRIPTESPRREPYLVEDAPLFYDPVTEERYRSLKAIDDEVGDFGLLYGSVVDRSEKLALINSVHGYAVVTDPPRDLKADRYGRVLIVGKVDGEATMNIANRQVKVPAVKAVSDGYVRPATAAELGAWVQEQDIDRFENWRSRKVWDERPKAKTVYDSAGRMGGGGVSIGRAEPREVITDPGKYRWQWLRGGKRIGPIVPMPAEQDAKQSEATDAEARADESSAAQ